MRLNYFLSFLLFVSAFMSLYIAYYSNKRNKVFIALAMLPVAIYAFGYAFEILSTTIQQITFWIKVEYIGIPFLGVFWLSFALDFTNYMKKIKNSILMLLYIIPIISLILNYTNDFHHLFYKKLYMNNQGPFPIVEVIRGPWCWVNTIYTYVLMFTALMVFLSAYSKASSVAKKQITLLILSWIIPWGSDIVYVLKLIPFNVDLCPLTLSFSGIIFGYAVFRYKLLKLESIAVEKVFSSMEDGVIILDAEDKIVGLNESSKKIIPELKEVTKGYEKTQNLLRKYAPLLDALNNISGNESFISIKNGQQLKHYKINISNIYENNDKTMEEIMGKILILNDISEIKIHQEKLAYNLNFLETLMDAIPNPIYSKDEKGTYIHCNTAFLKYLGKRKQDIIGQTSYEVFHKDLADIYSKKDKDLMDAKGNQTYESKLIHNDGTYHNVVIYKSVLLNEEGIAKGVVGVILDVTDQKKDKLKIERLLKLKEVMIKVGYCINEISNINELLQLILEEVINCIDAKSSGTILFLDDENNLKIIASKGYNMSEINNFSLKLEDHLTNFNNETKGYKTAVFNDISQIEKANLLPTVEGLQIKSIVSSPIIIAGQLYGFLNIDSIYNNFFGDSEIELMEYMRDQIAIAISKHKLHEETLYLSRYDRLTGVYNRGYLEDLIYEVIDNSNKEIKECYAVIFDLNGLKFINDNYGHLAGDEYIKTFSEGLRSLAKESDIIGRFGGDEFIAVFFHTNLQSLTHSFEDLQNGFKNNPVNFENHKIICRYNYGIVKFPDEGTDFKELIKLADDRMYKYKSRTSRTISNFTF